MRAVGRVKGVAADSIVPEGLGEGQGSRLVVCEGECTDGGVGLCW